LLPHHIKKIQKVEKLKLKCCSLVTLSVVSCFGTFDASFVTQPFGNLVMT
jgi:hypothetical protein